VTGQGNAIRTVWIDQRIVKYTASVTTDRQDFDQNWFVQYGFERIDPVTSLLVPIDEAIYHNELIIHQTDNDPNPALNYKIDPSSGLIVLDGKFHDTYNSAFRLTHTSKVRRYGFDFSGSAIGPEPGDTPLDPARIGKTNPTDDPFWGADTGPLGFDVDFNTNAKSGVGKETGFKFLYAQEVEGAFVSCLDCGGEHPITFPGGITYDFIFPLTPTAQPDNHPPDVSGKITIFGSVPFP
jgi:hypothetical protein